VTAVNGSLDATPELVNSDPYGEGWMYELRPSDESAVAALLDEAAYRAQLDLAGNPSSRHSAAGRRRRPIGFVLC
jgi:glycine cleavage system H lipoate-binding protein